MARKRSQTPQSQATATARALGAEQQPGQSSATPAAAAAENSNRKSYLVNRKSDCANPLAQLLPYQRAWYEDGSRFLVGRWGRQTGKSFSTAAIVAAAMIAQANTMWMIAAPSERQSHEALEKVKQWLAAFECAFAEELEALDGMESKAGAVRLSNGSRCIAVPGKPDTVRGMSANVWLDEFAFFEDPDATWKAILPSITNPLRGGEKRVILTSTPNGKAGRGKRFYDICSAARPTQQAATAWQAPENTPARHAEAPAEAGVTSMRWSHYHIPLRSAIADGLPVDYETLAAAIGDPLAVRQELDAEFVDTQSQLLPTEIILRAESEEATLRPAADIFTAGRDLRVGVDVGRVSDPTVIWTAERLGDVLYTREVLVLVGMSHADQLSMLRARVAAATRCCMDYTGMGIGMGDMLVREFGEYKPEAHRFGRVELCTFSASFKREIFPKLREAMEGCRLRIPTNAELRTDLSAMQQVCSGGQFSYEAPRTKDGHSDRCTAAALCVRAGAGVGNVPLPTGLPTGRKPGQHHRRRNHIAGGMRNRTSASRQAAACLGVSQRSREFSKS